MYTIYTIYEFLFSLIMLQCNLKLSNFISNFLFIKKELIPPNKDKMCHKRLFLFWFSRWQSWINEHFLTCFLLVYSLPWLQCHMFNVLKISVSWKIDFIALRPLFFARTCLCCSSQVVHLIFLLCPSIYCW